MGPITLKSSPLIQASLSLSSSTSFSSSDCLQANTVLPQKGARLISSDARVDLHHHTDGSISGIARLLRVRRAALYRLKAPEEERYSGTENNQNADDTAFPEGRYIEQYQRIGDDGNEGHSEERAEYPPAATGDPGAAEDHRSDDIELRANEIKRVGHTRLGTVDNPGDPSNQANEHINEELRPRHRNSQARTGDLAPANRINEPSQRRVAKQHGDEDCDAD